MRAQIIAQRKGSEHNYQSPKQIGMPPSVEELRKIIK